MPIKMPLKKALLREKPSSPPPSSTPFQRKPLELVEKGRVLTNPQKSLKQEAETWIKSRSLPIPQKPTFGNTEVVSPNDLTKLTDSQLNNLMNRVTIMADYLGYEMGKAEIDHLQLETEYNRYAAQLYLSTRTGNKRYIVLVDPASNRLQDRLNTATARVTLLRTMVDARDRQYKALSRDQTRRQGQYEKRGSY